MPSGLGSKILGGRRNYFWVAATVVVALDQFTKHIFVLPIGLTRDDIVLVPGLLEFVSQHNRRMAFSLGPSNPALYIVLAVFGLGLIGWFFVTTPPERLRPHLALGCVAGGALGNLVDRVFLPGVRDFISVYVPFLPWPLFNPWPTFNIADAAICVGVGLLIIEAFFSDLEKEEGSPEKATGEPDDKSVARRPGKSRRRSRRKAARNT